MQGYILAAGLTMLLTGAGGVEARLGTVTEERPQASWPSQAKPQQGQKPQGAQSSQAKPQQGQKPQGAGSQAKPQQGQKPQGAGSQAKPQQGAQGGRQNASGRTEGARSEPQRGQSGSARGNPGRGGGPERATRRVSRPVQMDRLPERLRPLAQGRNRGQRAAAVAVARGSEYGALPISYAIAGDRLRLTNQRDELLLDISDEEARNLGYWDVRRLDPDRVRDDAPSFCRSGEGHPVWGREWCIEKGFGLGGSDGWLWGRHNPDDVIFRRPDDRDSLDRGGLIDILGSVVLDRLALHAITLGLSDPLAGRWLGEPTGPRVMLLSSGSRPVAEMVDVDRDGRVDIMYVTSR